MLQRNLINRWLLTGGAVALLLAGLGFSSPRAAQADDDWPLFRGNALSQGVAARPLLPPLTVKWRHRVEEGSFEGTPTIVGKRVYVGDMDGQLFAFDIETGKPAWTAKSELGFVTAPAYRDGRLFLGDIDGVFHCYDARDGKELWRFSSDAEIDSSASFYKDKVLFGSQDATLYCLHQKDGSPAWKYTIADQIRCMPTVVENRAFVAGCDGLFHIIDIDVGKEVASVAIDSPTGATPAVLGDHVYFGTEAGVFFCVNWKTAKVVWRYQDERSSLPFRASAAVRSDVVVFAGHDKKVRAVEPQSGKLKWEFAAKSRIDCSPVLAGDRVWVGTARGRLLAIDLKDGKQSWEYECRGGILGGLAVAKGTLALGTDRGMVYAFGK